jgi:hypothetical protein
MGCWKEGISSTIPAGEHGPDDLQEREHLLKGNDARNLFREIIGNGCYPWIE